MVKPHRRIERVKNQLQKGMRPSLGGKSREKEIKKGE
jgi:hypothetical protein